MKIATTIDVEDFVYMFYQKTANEMGNTTPEELMSKALFMYAGMVATDILTSDTGNSIKQ